jgi:hypothetical protein
VVATTVFQGLGLLSTSSEVSYSFQEIKLFALGGVFFAAFIFFALSTRWAGQLSFLISIPQLDGEEVEVTSLRLTLLLQERNNEQSVAGSGAV